MMVALGREVVSAGAHSRQPRARGPRPRARTRAREERVGLPPIVKAVASRGEGIAAVAEAVGGRVYLEGTAQGAAKQHQRVREELRVIFTDLLMEEAFAAVGDALDAKVPAIRARAKTRTAAARALVERFRRG